MTDQKHGGARGGYSLGERKSMRNQAKLYTFRVKRLCYITACTEKS